MLTVPELVNDDGMTLMPTPRGVPLQDTCDFVSPVKPETLTSTTSVWLSIVMLEGGEGATLLRENAKFRTVAAFAMSVVSVTTL